MWRRPLPHRVFPALFGLPAAWIAGTGCSAACVFCTSGSIALAPERLEWLPVGETGVIDPAASWRHGLALQTPLELVQRAERGGVQVLYWSFNEPMQHAGYLVALGELGAARGMPLVIDTNGLSSPGDIQRVAPIVAAVYVGIKGSLRPAFYRRRMRVAADAVDVVKRAVLAWRGTAADLAISDVIEPPAWQPDDELAAAALHDCYSWIAEYVGRDVPLDIRPMLHPRDQLPTRLLRCAALPAETAAFDRRYELALTIAGECGLAVTVNQYPWMRT